MKVLIVDDNDSRADVLERELTADGHEVVAHITNSRELIEGVEELRPDMILIDMASPDRDTLESMRCVSRDNPRPIVMFAEKSDQHTIDEAVRAGVSAYVVDCVSPSRVKSIMRVATSRFREHQALKKELEETRGRLADRKDIDRAKGLLMKLKNMNEDDAYQALRKLAMDRNISIGEASRLLTAAADILG